MAAQVDKPETDKNGAGISVHIMMLSLGKAPAHDTHLVPKHSSIPAARSGAKFTHAGCTVCPARAQIAIPCPCARTWLWYL